MAAVAQIEVRGLAKRYRQRRAEAIEAVCDVSFDVLPGRVVAIVGPNGAGKTTTVQAILGLIKPTAGTISVFGRPPGDAVLHERIGYLPEDFSPYGFMTATDFLRYLGSLSGASPEVLSAAIPDTLRRVGLADATRPVRAFSKGMRQRLGLAQALVHSPRLLILDEPSSGLDPEGRARVTEIVEAEREKGTAVLLCTHLLVDVERVCDDLVVFKEGRVAMSGTIEEVLRRDEHYQMVAEGWTPAAARMFATFPVEVAEVRGTRVTLQFSADVRSAVLAAAALQDLEVIDFVARTERSLEAAYLELVGGTS